MTPQAPLASVGTYTPFAGALIGTATLLNLTGGGSSFVIPTSGQIWPLGVPVS
jgi:hypothetical protein